MRSYVGVDLHRRRSVVVCLDEDGNRRWWRRIENSPQALAEVIGEAGAEPEVVVEATFGWYWAADVISEAGGRTHLAHPLRSRGVRESAGQERPGRCHLVGGSVADGQAARVMDPAGFGASAPRAGAVSTRHKLSQLRSGLKAQIHGVLGKEGVIPDLGWLWGPGGDRFLDDTSMGDAYEYRLESLRDLIEVYDREVSDLDRRIGAKLRDDTGYRAILQLTGIGPVFGGIFVAEVGDVSRFANPKKLCCWAGLTPRLRESDTKTIQGPITKQGSKLVRWAAIEAVVRSRGGAPIRDTFMRVADRWGVNRAKVAAARKLLTLVYYGLRDGEIRCLAPDREQAA